MHTNGWKLCEYNKILKQLLWMWTFRARVYQNVIWWCDIADGYVLVRVACLYEFNIMCVVYTTLPVCLDNQINISDFNFDLL